MQGSEPPEFVFAIPGGIPSDKFFSEDLVNPSFDREYSLVTPSDDHVRVFKYPTWERTSNIGPDQAQHEVWAVYGPGPIVRVWVPSDMRLPGNSTPTPPQLLEFAAEVGRLFVENNALPQDTSVQPCGDPAQFRPMIAISQTPQQADQHPSTTPPPSSISSAPVPRLEPTDNASTSKSSAHSEAPKKKVFVPPLKLMLAKP